MSILLNQEIARRLKEVAQLLHEQGANPFRVKAYQTAAQVLERLDIPIADIIAQEGTDGVQKLPGIGLSLARSIHTLALTGRLPMLDRLRGEMEPAVLLASVPGVGEGLARRLHDDLGLETLEQLEMAAHDGRLSDIEGVGPKKLQGIIDSLAGRLGRIRRPVRTVAAHGTADAPVEELFEVDWQYREAARKGTLRTIAPHRFNPKREAWLPILHTQRGGRHYTAMFSNTALAHRLKQTHDWVILYYDHEDGEHQCTVITGHKEPFIGKRVIRGREDDCATYYRAHSTVTSTSGARESSG